MRIDATRPQKYQSSFRVLSKAAKTITKIAPIIKLKPTSNFVMYFSWWLFDMGGNCGLGVNSGQK